MVILSGRSAGVSIREIDLSGPQRVSPVGVPAGIIGTAERGPAFVPLTFATLSDFTTMFGGSDGTKFGPLAVAEWLRNAQAVTFTRVLGVGRGEKKTSSGDNSGRVESAGFVVGQRLPLDDGFLGHNPYANENGVLGRTYFLGCYMSQSAGSTVFTDAGIQIPGDNLAHPIIRGVLMAPSGVTLTLSSSFASDSSAPAASAVATAAGPNGAITGTVDLSSGRQNFVMLLNGHKGNDASNPNVITASFDQTAQNFFGNVFNSDPLSIQTAGHLLYARFDVYPTLAAVTGTGIIPPGDVEQPIAFLTSGALARNVGSTTVPSYENFEERYTTPASPTVISQKFGGKYTNLFRVFALSDGANANEKYKISIRNVAKSTIDDNSYGTFDLLVRDFNDNDKNEVVFESFSGLNLDPESDNYIARRIGDMHAYFDFDKNEAGQRLVVEGKYPNVSGLIRVEMDNDVDAGEVDATALPVGFRGPFHLVTSGTAPLTAVDVSADAISSGTAHLTTAGDNSIKRAVQPPVPFRLNITQGDDPKKTVNKQLYWGVQFENQTSLVEPNLSQVSNKTIRSLTKFFPTHQASWRNFAVGENAGTADSGGTVLDSDRFNNNLFALDRIQVRTGSNGIVDAKELVSMSYVRDGNITANEGNKTRALSVELDFGDLTVRRLAKFSFYMQGGFDGVNIFNSDTANLTNAAVKQEMDDSARGQNLGPTVKAYQKALDVMGNPSDVDIKALAIPGMRHSIITDDAINTVASDRFDAIYIMDVEERDTLNSVVTSSLQDVHVGNTSTQFSLRGLDSNFAAAYFPDVVVESPFTGLPTSVPPSVVVMGALSRNDAVAFPWFAPAGYTRGALQSTESVALNLNRANMDTLQDARINPIVSFPGSDGVVVWGQKTLQAAQSALDRVNVRRLLIELRRQVKQIANSLIFEPNREATLVRFSGLVNPVLQRVQEQQGINRFRVIIDATTTTQADIENNTVRGKIFVEPTRTAEVAEIDFIVTNQGA